MVGEHLAAAGGLLDEDPQTALLHAQAARERASRIAVVREAVGVAAYHAGDFTEAARELRAYRRMSGDESYRAVLADCERALGRPDAALRLVAEALAEDPSADDVVELRLVEAGARQDLGELPAAALVLEAALGGRPVPEQLQPGDLGQLRLATAYADLLAARGDEQQAQVWLEAVMAADPDDETGVAARFDDLDDDADDDDADDGDDDGDGLDDEPDGELGSGELAENLSDDGLVDDAADGDVDTSLPGAVEGADEGSDDVSVGDPVSGGTATADPGSDAPATAGPETTDGSSEEDSAGAGVPEVELPDTDVGADYDPDEQDVEQEVAELLGEIPVPGFSDTQADQPVLSPQPRPLPTGTAGLFSAPEDGTGGEHTPPTN